MKLIKGTPEYIEFRKKANQNNRRYYSKPEVKLERKIYKREYERKIYKREYERKNKDKINARNRERNRILREKGLLWSQKYPERVRAYRQKEESRIRKRAADKKYYHTRIKSNLNKYQQELKRHRDFRKNNLDTVKNYNKKYYSSPKGIINYTKHNHQRLALIKERPFDLSKEKIIQIFDRDKVCVYCGSNINLELDHIIPLKLGGNSLFNNFVLACESCNCRKSGTDVFIFCKNQGIEMPKIVIELLKKQKE